MNPSDATWLWLLERAKIRNRGGLWVADSLDTADIEVAELGEPSLFGGPLFRPVYCQPSPRPVQFALEADGLQDGGGDALRWRYLHLAPPFCWRSLFGYINGTYEWLVKDFHLTGTDVTVLAEPPAESRWKRREHHPPRRRQRRNPHHLMTHGSKKHLVHMWSNANLKVTCRRSSDNFLAHGQAALQEGLDAERSHESVQTKRPKKRWRNPLTRTNLRALTDLCCVTPVHLHEGSGSSTVRVACFALCCLRRLCVDVVKCCLCHWSCLVLSLRSACLFEHKGSGSYVHLCPRPCLSTCRWARLATHRHWGPLCVSPVLSCPLWPCNRRMCVITKETGQSPLARTCSRTWVFLRRLHILALSLCLTPSQKTTIQKIGDNSSGDRCLLRVFQPRVFRPAGRHMCRIYITSNDYWTVTWKK